MNHYVLQEQVYDLELIAKNKQKINAKLKKYIEDNIVPEYQLNDGGHDINHINYVLNRALEIGDAYHLNMDVLYTCVMYHDIACHIDRKRHEVLSGIRAYEDVFLNTFFFKEEMIIIKEAIEDHRASLNHEPRNLYGKIVSSADRKVDVKTYLISALSFDMKKYPEMTKEELIEDSYLFANEKYGKEGYAIKKSYVNDQKYKQFLQELQYLIENKDLYNEVAQAVYEEIKNKQYTLVK
ncbi:MAG: hypothetical protein PHN72_00330 [Bacilli bacterium]|nr:hypothetical protein [Bacilli bacterium]